MSLNAKNLARNGQKGRYETCNSSRKNGADWKFAEAGYSRNLRSASGLAGLIARSYAEAAAVQGQRDRRCDLGVDKGYGSYQPNSLIALSNKGIKKFEEKHPGVLPHNLYKAGPSGQGYYAYNHHCSSHDEYENIVGGHARFSGWIATAADLPLVVRAIKQSVSAAGNNARRTYVNLWQVARKYNSPHTLKRRILAVQWRARQILAAYDGRGCSLRSVMIALKITGSTGKAALIAAHRSLTGKDAQSYRDAREELIKIHLCMVEDTRDGVTVHHTRTPVYQKFGIQIYACIQKSSSGWKEGFLVIRAERSYHIFIKKSVWYTPEEIYKIAIRDWRHQDEAAKVLANKFCYLSREDVTILITREDSAKAGNCSPGTESWISSTGIGNGRWCVPAKLLLPHTDNQRVANVLAVANREAGVWLKTHNLV